MTFLKMLYNFLKLSSVFKALLNFQINQNITKLMFNLFCVDQKQPWLKVASVYTSTQLITYQILYNSIWLNDCLQFGGNNTKPTNMKNNLTFCFHFCFISRLRSNNSMCGSICLCLCLVWLIPFWSSFPSQTIPPKVLLSDCCLACVCVCVYWITKFVLRPQTIKWNIFVSTNRNFCW